MTMIKYLVFDVDNTLIDFDMSLIRTEKMIADRLGILVDSCEVTLTSYHGNEYPGIAALLRNRKENPAEEG